jgi:hypothetical protein
MGLVTAKNAPALLDAVFEGKPLVQGLDGAMWRGRRGLNKEQQLELYARATEHA